MSEYVVEEPSSQSASWRVHERIVRCRDCKHSYIHDMTAMYPDGSRNARYCGRWSYLMQMVDDSDFCSFGDRREDE